MQMKRSIGRKISFLMLVMIFLSTAVIGSFSYYFYRRDAIAVSADKAMTLAQSVGSAIEGEEFRAILDSGIENEYWHDVKRFADNVKTRTGVEYLYLLDKNYDDNVRYFMEGTLPGDDDVIGLGELESVDVHADELFETLRTGEPSTTEIYDAEEYGMMVSGFAPILNTDGSVAGVVGVDINVDDVLASSHFFRNVIFGCVVIFSVLFWIISMQYAVRRIARPIAALSEASTMISRGDMNINLTVSSSDEIGALTKSFLEMAESTGHQVEALEKLAGGDLTASVVPRCERDTMSFALLRMIDNLGGMFGEISRAAAEVNTGSRQISDGAQTLAQGSSEQAAAVSELSASLGQIAHATVESARMAHDAARLSDTIRQSAEQGSQQMDEMIDAVTRINEASQGIGKVMKVIDDIAFQTNILALNAAVEAARAGQHGKGFAVVAGEVRNLAAKSAEAAKDSNVLITDSMEKAALGSRIAGETAASLSHIVSGINESNRVVLSIAKSADEQKDAVDQINKSIDMVSQVVHRTSAAAEESAAASEEMSAQAVALHEIVAKFKLKDTDSAFN